MITNIPKYEEFEALSKQCLTQAFNLLYKVYNDHEESDESIKSEVSLDEIWSYNSGTIRTSLILLHQGIETYMKAVVCRTTPLLLIDKARADWPTLPMRADKEFDSLYTISGEALLTTFFAVPSESTYSDEFIKFIEDIRQKRNSTIHGANDNFIKAEELLECILKAYTYCFDKDTWFFETRNFTSNHPLFGYYDSDVEYAAAYKYLDFALAVLGKKRLQKFLKHDISGREYFCPKCKETIDGDYDYLDSKWGFLIPNKSDSTNLYCINCDTKFKVVRNKCIEKGCKGNVIHDNEKEKRCLTCFEPQEND